MSISGKILFDKVRGLRSELSGVVTPEILNKICDQPSVQTFLQWFCDNVNYVNVLSNEDIQIKNKLQAANEWLEGADLDLALEEATKDCPDLLKIASFDETDINDMYAEFEIVKDLYKEDESYIHTLRNGIQNLRKLEVKLDEDIENEEELLDRECIEANKAHRECSILLKDFDIHIHEFLKKFECLLNVYADAAENKGLPVLWTQMPLELLTKKIELYNHYLDVHIKRQFGNLHGEEPKTDSNYVSLITNSKEKCMDNEIVQDLTLCKTNLTNAKMEEILAKVQEESYIAMFNYVQDIYNFGSMKVPRTNELRTDISELTRKRDFLEENVSLLQERQLTEVVQQFSELEITNILKQHAQARLERRCNHLEKLKHLRFLAREHGHVRTDLLRILMNMQSHLLGDVAEFVADARHYVTTEYMLSSVRCESMQQQQNEYSASVACSPKVHNAFQKLFIQMVCNEDSNQPLHFALDKYNEIIAENKVKKQCISSAQLNSRIDKLETLENDANSQYLDEMKNSATRTFRPVPYDIDTCHSEAFDSLQKVQADLTKIRRQMKERLKVDATFEQEKNVLWQRFLVDPETLKRTHKEVKQMINKSCFAENFTNE